MLKGLIALFVTSSALFSMATRSDAQVNMKTLVQVAKSCQKDVVSENYYQEMGLNINNHNLIFQYLYLIPFPDNNFRKWD